MLGLSEQHHRAVQHKFMKRDERQVYTDYYLE